MRVYKVSENPARTFSDVIFEVKNIREKFYRETGQLPTRIEMTKKDVDLLVAFLSVKTENTKGLQIMGMEIVIKE